MSTLTIDKVDRTQRVGVPFNITMCFEDAEGNIKFPEDWESFKSQKPSIAITAKRRNPDVMLTFTWGELCVVEDKLVVHDIVATGNLLDHASEDCQLEIEIQMNSVTHKCKLGKIEFRTGPPAEITCEEELLTIENGTKASVTCRVLDSNGNSIFAGAESESKMILLTCNIYKCIKCEDNSWTEGELNFIQTVPVSTNKQKMPMSERIFIAEVNTSQCAEAVLLCKISYDQFPDISPARMQIHVIRSTRPEMVKVYQVPCDRSESDVEIPHGSERFEKIGDQLGLGFKLFDCLGHEVSFDASKHWVYVNWSKERVHSQERLPILDLPTRAESRRELTTTIEMVAYDEIVHHTFYLTSHALDPCALHANFAGSHPNNVSVPIGESVPDIHVKIMDQYGNAIAILDPEHLITDFDLKVNDSEKKFEVELASDLENTSFVIKNLKIFESNEAPASVSLGSCTLSLNYQNKFPALLMLCVVPGRPTELVLEVDGKRSNLGIMTIKNRSYVEIRAWFVDAANNKTKPLADAQINFSLKPTIDDFDLLENHPVRNFTLKVNSLDPIVDFGHVLAGVQFRRSKPVYQVTECQECDGKCYGKAIAVNIEVQICGEILKRSRYLHIIQRSDLPFRIVPVYLGGTKVCSYKAGSTFEHFSVALYAEDGSRYKEALKEDLTLRLDSGSHNVKCLPDNVIEGLYTFHKVPTTSGVYKTELFYKNASCGETQCISLQCDDFVVYPAETHCIQPDIEVNNITVTNSLEEPMNRIIIPTTTFILKDQYGNSIAYKDTWPGGLPFVVPKGVLKIEISDGVILENHAALQYAFQFTNGQAILPQPLVFSHGVNLQNNSQHDARFTATLEDGSMFFYRLDFTFFSNVQHCQEILKLQTDITNLQTVHNRKLANLNVAREKLMCLLNEEKYLTRRIENCKIGLENVAPRMGVSLTTSDGVGREMEFLRRKRLDIESQRRMTECNILEGPWAEEPKVLGLVGLLAEIRSEGHGHAADVALQKLLSWHLQSTLGAVVTETSDKAQELERKYGGQRAYEFLPLDVMTVRPHFEENLLDFTTAGNPVYARSMLHFPSHMHVAATKVFDNILDNTIVVDSLESAINLMKIYNDRSLYACPTILTRDGHRLENDGVIGRRSCSVPENFPSSALKLGLAPNAELKCISNNLTELHKLKLAFHDAEEYQVANGAQMESLTTECARLEGQLRMCARRQEAAHDALRRFRLSMRLRDS